MASSASHSRASSRAAWAWRDPRRPEDRSNSRLEYAASAANASGARPRLVCSRTPVAFTTGWRSARLAAWAWRRARSSTPSGLPSAMAFLAASTNSGWGRPVSASDRARGVHRWGSHMPQRMVRSGGRHPQPLIRRRRCRCRGSFPAPTRRARSRPRDGGTGVSGSGGSPFGSAGTAAAARQRRSRTRG